MAFDRATKGIFGVLNAHSQTIWLRGRRCRSSTTPVSHAGMPRSANNTHNLEVDTDISISAQRCIFGTTGYELSSPTSSTTSNRSRSTGCVRSVSHAWTVSELCISRLARNKEPETGSVKYWFQLFGEVPWNESHHAEVYVRDKTGNFQGEKGESVIPRQ